MIINYKKLFSVIIIIFSCYFCRADSDWLEKESEHFRIIYRESHSHLVPHILTSAENSLNVLIKIFNYFPKEKIIINTYDINDYGFGAATSVPENFIRLEIEPFEPGYENVPYNDRFQWVLSHELVHIVINDKASGIEETLRSMFSKVPPEQVQPVTILFSLLTNFNRFTPRWYQEASAVFLETWLSGGYGRILGNFDEMYFRTLTVEGKDFPDDIELDAKLSHNSFLLETLFYLYGGRFGAYLAVKYGPDKLIEWLKTEQGYIIGGFKNNFESVFRIDFYDAWNDFEKFEKEHQNKNIEKLKKYNLTDAKKLSNHSFGWITEPYLLPGRSIILGSHRSHNLAEILKYNLFSEENDHLITLPSPSIYQVASTAMDTGTGLFFYTTNNNQLFRDVNVLDISSEDSKILFQDCRVGQLTISPVTHELWGVQHFSGEASIVFSPYPYKEIITAAVLPVGDEVQQLALSTSGSKMIMSVHKISGEQVLGLINTDELKNGSLNYNIITDQGTPEGASWSPDDDFIYWNAYTNGVSNIYSYSFKDSVTKPLSHTLIGLFKPVYLNADTLLAFEFTPDGFIPVLIPNRPAEYLPAISYLGQQILDKNSKLLSWRVNGQERTSAQSFTEEKDYNGLSSIKFQSFVPVITGFQKQKVLGFFTHLADPLLDHDMIIEAGYSPFKENPAGPKFHVKFKYDYMKRFEAGLDHNAADFYDLFNSRKRSVIGTKIRLGYTGYWLYDNPHKIKQQAEIALYTDFQYINDNLVRVSEPDFMVGQSVFNSKNLRRSIGSSDFESGDDITATVMVFGSDPKDPQFATSLHAEWDNFNIFITPHNVLHFKLAGGYHFKNDRLMQARFYFGGFGNREVENVDVKQYRSVFRFPGIPIYSLAADRYVKILLENNLPPIRFGWANIGQHYLNHIDISIYSQGLITKSEQGSRWVDIGAQINFIFKHWFNLESTFSAGIAHAWFSGGRDNEWFLSYKLLRN